MLLLESLLPIIAVLSTFGSISFFVYMHYTSRHRERMAMIQQGKDPMQYKIKLRKTESYRLLKVGILLASFGLGLVAGWALELGGMPSETAYFSMIFMFGGIGMIIYHLSQRKKLEEKEDFLAEEL